MARPIKNGDPTKNGEPTKADTARLVNYHENLIKALEDAGYILNKRTPILETRYETDRSQDEEAYKKSIDVNDLYEGVVRTPYLADDILGYAAGLRANASQLGGNRFEISESKRRAIVESFEEHLATLKNNSVDPRNWSRIEERVKRLKDKIEGGDRDFLKEASAAGSSLYQAFNENRDNLSNDGADALSEVYDNIEFVNQNEYRLSPRAAMIGALGVSGIADLDYYQSLSDQGYTYPDSPEIRYDGKITPSSIAKSIGNFGIDLYNRFNMKQDYVDKGDKGKSWEVTNPDEMVEKFEGGDIIDSMFSVYPNVKTDHTKVETPWSKEKGQYYKDLGEGFYEDREYDRVQNFDIPPSLFREGVTPASIKTFWNEDKKDFVEVYDYDSPEFKEGVPPPTDKETPPPVRVKKVPPPVRVKKTPPPPTRSDYSVPESGFSFTPMFGGNIQQTGFRGLYDDLRTGTSGALTGVFMDFKNPDGTMDRIKTRLEDVPEYITKDPYFERLLDRANSKYFNMERESGAQGVWESVKTPEAQMIGRILSGDITIDEAKRQAMYTHASF